jgi:ketosteroid isomerase-like protein
MVALTCLVYRSCMNYKQELSIACAPISDPWAEEFANNWLTAWNSKDVERISEYYSDEIFFASPAVEEMTGYQDGILLKKSEFKNMCSKIFQEIPELRYSLVAVAVGINSLTMHYKSSQFDLVADVVKFDSGWKITKSQTYY